MRTPEPRTIITFSLLGAGALISSFIIVDLMVEEDRKTKPELSLAYYLDRAELTGTGPDGTVLYQVWTDRAAQSIGDESISLARSTTCRSIHQIAPRGRR